MRRGDVTARRLQKDFRAVYRNAYVAKRVPVTALTRARAAWLWADGDCVMTGLSAAAIHGAKWIDAGLPAELNRADRHGPSGILCRSSTLESDECCVVDGIRLTTPERTAFDVGRRIGGDQGIVHLDALANATRLDGADVLTLADRHPGARGVRILRSAIGQVDGGAESPRETALRLLLVRAGLPRPETQIEFRDRYGRVRIRVDMGWREWKVAVEYDGVQHWADRRQRSWDIDRIAMLESRKWTVVRVGSELMNRPDVIVTRVLEKLRRAGCPI
ncbi:DUF559 domain-containing protein [Mycolicibacterium sediminis]|uniref:DUF559 domain-containing protein n=1 Tax=Mycolicibacterium sediminis TaxID=1286180 RepID=A0A7I7QND4_9MYCO|nr:hypothetical protein MSEDJ_18810 [Mycolicibacterium sediminis]